MHCMEWIETMTAWSEIQNVWTRSNDQKETTGILLWDLSAAFDTIDHGILCQKLQIYKLRLKIIVNKYFYYYYYYYYWKEVIQVSSLKNEIKVHFLYDT